MDSSVEVIDERASSSDGGSRGGWIAFPFVIGTMACLSFGAGGWISNLIVYLIQEFNINNIPAAKVFNFVNGSITMFPIVGAVIADSFLGSFAVIWISSLISLLGTSLILLTAAVDQLRPPACGTGCRPYPSGIQLAVLYLGLGLASLGNAGTRFTIATFGADQFSSQKHQRVFFNWYIFAMYMAAVVSSTAIVYVEDNVSWSLGFGLSAAANVVGLVVFLCGRRYYRIVKPQGSPFTNLARVVVGAVGRRRLILSEKAEDYYHRTPAVNVPSHFFRFLNRAALRRETDHLQGAKSCKKQCCTVQQVEDLKRLIKMVPLWSTGLFLCIPLAIQLSLVIIQALTMDRRLGSGLKFPAGSMPVFILISTSACILLIVPLWERFSCSRTPLTLLQRVGVGHAINIISMAVSAVVESKRLSVARSRNLQHQSSNAVVPMSVFWLVPQLVVAGMGEAVHFPAQIALYYQEFPESLKSTSTAAVAMFIGIAFYVSNAVIDLVQKTTGWLPDDINQGRLDNVYWLCCALGGLNFAYYLVCSTMYKYQNVGDPAVVKADDISNS